MKFSFQTILIGIFLIAFVVAILIFSGVIGTGATKKSSQAITGSILVWGSYRQDIIQPYFDKLNIQNTALAIRYEEHSTDTFATDLIAAIANGTAPDLVLSDSQHLFSFRDKLYTIPFSTYNERLYRDTFVDGAAVFLNKDGVLAIPLVVDPLVLYYNKDILAGQSYVVPPTTWTGLVQSLPRFVKKDARGVITQTSIGLGEADNVDHFKDILSALFLQTGNSIVAFNKTNQLYESKIGFNTANGDLATAKALDFYTGFANQASSSFAWTRSLPSSLDMFLSGKSAFYIGRASELFTIQARNPNLSFDVTNIFQTEGAPRPITFGVFDAVGLLKSTRNFPAAYNVEGIITSKEFTSYLSKALSLPPARRDLLLEQQQNPYIQVYFKAALSAFAWPDVNNNATETVFRNMIRAVNSGRANASQAIYEASNDLQSAIK